MNTDVLAARDLAERLLSPLPRRWAHSQGVAARARVLAERLGRDGDVFEAAGYLHDIGYGPSIAFTQFHPIDGARYLRDHQAVSPLIYELVAHHSGAQIEAEERGFGAELVEEFGTDDRNGELLTILTAADMTTSPDGLQVEVEDRINEIFSRYQEGDPVHRAISRSCGSLIANTRRIVEAVDEQS